jgi:hypothetical protein
LTARTPTKGHRREGSRTGASSARRQGRQPGERGATV